VSMLDRIVAQAPADGTVTPGRREFITEPAQLSSRVSAWEAVQAARNIQRPHTLDVIGASSIASTSFTVTAASATDPGGAI